MFIGEYQHNLDSKGRIVMPSKFRDELTKNNASIIVTKGLDGCLNVYTLEKWETIYEKLLTLPTTSKSARMYVRMITSKATECTFDGTGKILLPQTLIEEANITKEAIIVGVADHVEIWSKDNWMQFENDGDESLEAIAEELSSYGI